ncbi:VWA domain-containing protein [Luteolibacter ambystomatis]|uniref:VWA domain-containing protein n=1 Tax=Luteolibacter ambystomatis TaxID=2824561 RepID=A0A975IZZ3_9BACT|nr:VIT domain-containing protein [Luteolibacter ambystomatis]QUE50925.1 VWA domain-containing protein [Luteolibacter ambystomatis]
MKVLLRLIYFAAVFGFLAAASPGETTAAPYFHATTASGEKSGGNLPLKSSTADVWIDGTIARISLEQVYANTGDKPMEAIYVFPASTRAAVHGMTLATGGRTITARIKEKTAAKTEYEQAKSQKRTAALLEEQRPNVFQMSVANILPGDDIHVTVQWSESIPATDGTYEFVFPTVVGPRYGHQMGGATETWSANPHLEEGKPSPAGFQLAVNLSTALPLAEVKCTSHPVNVDFQSKSTAAVKLVTKTGEEAANRDFILRWKLGQDRVDAGLLLHKGEKENHFLLQVEPPKRVTPDLIPLRDYVFVLDISGSMQGFPLQTAKDLLTQLTSVLRPDDTFNIVTFSGGSEVLSLSPVANTPAMVEQARNFITKQQSGGGTELGQALDRAFALPGSEGRSRSIVVMTDGFVGFEREVFTSIRSRLGQANLFSVGIGSSVNRHLIEGMARAGQGEPFVITQPSEVNGTVTRFRDLIASPVLAKIRVEAEGVELSGIEPSPYPDLFANRPLVIAGRWSGEAKGRIIIRGIAGHGEVFEKSVDLAEATASGTDHPALPVLWARERVRHLEDELVPTSDRSIPVASPESIREVTALGLTYQLLTPYTSFVAVDETPRGFDGLAQTVKQPLPLPAGVSNSAIGTTPKPIVVNGSVPEPDAIGLISLLVTLLALQRRR